MTKEQRETFDRLREILASEDVLLSYPDFKRPFDLTTDASGFGLGAVLSQDGRPITMISRALRDNEKNYATNERELLAIVWALKNLRNYLYGVKGLQIFTDHQPLTFAVSDKNPNAKLKRWKGIIDDHGAKLVYKPGKENHVADALSRQNINVLEDEGESDVATIHSEQSLTYTIDTTDNPINCFRNQIIIEEGNSSSVDTFILFRSKVRHIIKISNRENLLSTLQDEVNAEVVNAIHCSLPILAFIQHRLVELFPSTPFKYTKSFVQDITDITEQREIVIAEHNRAHRAAQENVKQILRDYFFPKMLRLATETTLNCKTCSMAKYKRHPSKQVVAETPIPSFVGEILHIDIFSTDGTLFLTCIDKFSKFATVQAIASRAIVDVKSPLLQIINFFPIVKTIYCDNERSFNSETIKSILLNHFNITIANAPPLHSTSNGQVERFHSTLTEIARCLKLEGNLNDTTELILLATNKYNNTIHSVTNEKPVQIVHSKSADFEMRMSQKIQQAQKKTLDYVNKDRTNRDYLAGEKVFLKANKRLGNKL